MSKYPNVNILDTSLVSQSPVTITPWFGDHGFWLRVDRYLTTVAQPNRNFSFCPIENSGEKQIGLLQPPLDATGEPGSCLAAQPSLACGHCPAVCRRFHIFHRRLLPAGSVRYSRSRQEDEGRAKGKCANCVTPFLWGNTSFPEDASCDTIF